MAQSVDPIHNPRADQHEREEGRPEENATHDPEDRRLLGGASIKKSRDALARCTQTFCTIGLWGSNSRRTLVPSTNREHSLRGAMCALGSSRRRLSRHPVRGREISYARAAGRSRGCCCAWFQRRNPSPKFRVGCPERFACEASSGRCPLRGARRASACSCERRSRRVLALVASRVASAGDAPPGDGCRASHRPQRTRRPAEPRVRGDTHAPADRRCHVAFALCPDHARPRRPHQPRSRRSRSPLGWLGDLVHAIEPTVDDDAAPRGGH